MDDVVEKWYVTPVWDSDDTVPGRVPWAIISEQRKKQMPGHEQPSVSIDDFVPPSPEIRVPGEQPEDRGIAIIDYSVQSGYALCEQCL